MKLLALSSLLGLAACTAPVSTSVPERDPHSHARPDEVRVSHMALDLDVDFAGERLEGSVRLDLDRRSGSSLWLDVNGLRIDRVRLEPGGTPVEPELTEQQPYVGRGMRIPLDEDTAAVRIDYATGPGALALQWLEPEQTSGGDHPFLLTQSQSVFARTWIPCQDSPGIRSTYEARIRVPTGLQALMSAANPTGPSADGAYEFRMNQPVPAYLVALAVGEIERREIGPRTAIWAEPPVIDAAAWEFAETESMLAAIEGLYGPYRWGRFDVVVLPAGFPFGGMENPRLTFVTPTLLAGDRSLVATVAHEAAHSWSGNLVTNATWNDFWINEGFTSYIEKRIMEALYGTEHAEMLWELDVRSLRAEIDDLPDEATRLRVELDRSDPEDSFTVVAYEKGALLLRMLEEQVGRERWDEFLESYFTTFAFRSMTSDRFVAFLDEQLLDDHPEGERLAASVRAWIREGGLPADAPVVESATLAAVDRQRDAWAAGLPAARLETDGWGTHERLHFLRTLPEEVTLDRLAELDRVLGLTAGTNAEVLHAWLVQTIRRGYEPARPALERFLEGMGRLKFLGPLYRELASTPAGLELARSIYARARPGYHAIARAALDPTFGPGKP